jgi:hypothetical protein
MRTDAAIVKDLKLLPLKDITLVGNSVGVILARKVRRRMAAIAKGLVTRLPAAAQCRLRLQRNLLTQPIGQVLYLGEQVRPVPLDPNLRFGIRWVTC